MKLFSKRKNKNSEIENREVRDNKEAEPRTTIIHSQRICKGLLYSTEDSELVVCWKHSDSCEEDKAALFKTKNGRWFRCLQKTKKYVYFNLDICKYIVEEKKISYSNIIPINEDYAKRTVGDYDVQKYMELWGDEVEEA
jgi:hypothetical protein|nr:MAG TPA: hypothetical protein [Caudoviricetes sp.]